MTQKPAGSPVAPFSDPVIGPLPASRGRPSIFVLPTGRVGESHARKPGERTYGGEAQEASGEEASGEEASGEEAGGEEAGGEEAGGEEAGGEEAGVQKGGNPAGGDRT